MPASRQPDPLFLTADGFSFRRDVEGRLRIASPPGMEPVAAWLMGDVQENLAGADRYRGYLDEARHASAVEDRRVDGNACTVAVSQETSFLISQYDLWEPLILPRADLESAFDLLRAYLVEETERGWRSPERAEGCYRATVGWQDEETGAWRDRPITDHTFFPEQWASERVTELVMEAGRSPSMAVDVGTGAWSAIAGGLHLFGYLDAKSGRPLTAFPIIDA
ncbi:MAG: EndoU domain-containing protein [Candidatus Dormibacteraceae bacterium]